MGTFLSKWFSSKEESPPSLKQTDYSGATELTDIVTSHNPPIVEGSMIVNPEAVSIEERCDQLTNRQIVRLAAAIAVDNMESIAEGYLDLSPETVKNIRRDASNSEAFNRDVIRYWANKNPEGQVKVG